MTTENSQEDLLAKIKSMLTEQLNPITKRLDSIEQSLSQITEHAEKIKDLEVRFEKQDVKCKQLQKDLTEANMQNKKLCEDLLLQETYSRKHNIRLYGISVQNSENLEEKVIKVLKDVGITLTPQDTDRIHFVGQARPGVGRAVLLRLLRWKDKQTIMKKKERFRQINILMQEDYPKEVINRRRMLLPVFFKSLKLYPALSPKFLVDKFVLGGKMITVENVNSIQYPELLPECVFTPTKSGVQAYYTKYSPLSNFYPAKIEAEGRIFPTSEHYFTFKKALHFEDNESAQAILDTKDPEGVKALGKKIQGFHKTEWQKVSSEYMYQAMLLKFTQNENLRGFLLSTMGNKLIEASGTDKHWGIGQSLRSPDLFNEAKWTGKNIAGKTLERVRQTIM